MIGSSLRWLLQGTFATSLMPNSTCTPDAMGFLCDEVRIRGEFKAYFLPD